MAGRSSVSTPLSSEPTRRRATQFRIPDVIRLRGGVAPPCDRAVARASFRSLLWHRPPKRVSFRSAGRGLHPAIGWLWFCRGQPKLVTLAPTGLGSSFYKEINFCVEHSIQQWAS